MDTQAYGGITSDTPQACSLESAPEVSLSTVPGHCTGDKNGVGLGEEIFEMQLPLH
jgi:hypothetical protein